MILLVVLIILSGIFSASETALTSFRSTFLEEIEWKYPKETTLLKSWLKYPNEILTGMLLGNNIVNILASSIATALTLNIMGNNSTSILVSTIVMTVVILIFGEITPKIIAKNNSILISRIVIVPMHLLSVITKPIVFILMGISKIIGRLFGIEIKDEALMITEKDIISFVNVGEAEGIIEEGEKEMIHSIFEFGETSAKEVMTPRTSMYSIEATKTIEEVWDELLETGFSRIPVYEETIDDVIGILYVKDILKSVKKGETERRIKEFVRIPYFVPETKSIIEILKEFQIKKVHIAMALDEYGGVVGLVTIEDLIEEIVGEIRDEFDQEEEETIIKISETEYIIDAMIDIETLNKELSLELPISEDYESLGGLITTELSKVCAIGDSVVLGDVKLEVKELDKMRISRVLLEKITGEER
ncbi:MAG: hemolysin family protein [Fusobacteriaceae bacterium]